MSSYQYPPPPPGGQPPTGYPQPGFQQPQQPQQPYPQQPQQPQQPYPQQPYQQQPQQPYQQQPGGMYPAPPQGAPMPQGYGQPHQAAPPATPATMPQAYAIDDAAMAAQYKQAKEEMQRGGGAGFLKVPGPQGQVKWDSSVPIGYEGSVFVHICGPWAQGKPLFVRKKKYFWKSRSKPNGTSIIVPSDGDLIAQAIELASQSTDPQVQQFVKDFGKPRTNYLYNVLQLDNPGAHIGQDGVMRPLILDEGKQLHTAIGDVFTNAEGASNIVDYQNGRPVRLIRKKTGPRVMDIEWTAMPAMNPTPVPQEFWPALQNLWDLEKFVKYPTLEEMQAAILDMGLPMPGQAVQSQVPMNYNPGAAPPYPNPYQQPPQQQMAPQGYQQPPQGYQQGYQQSPQQPPQQPPQPAQSFGPPPGMAPPPVSSQQPQGGYQGAPPPAGPPPGMNPPPISSENPQMPQPGMGPPPVPATAQGQPPQQSQMPAGPPPPPAQGQPQQPQGQPPQQAQGQPPQEGMQLSLPLPEGTKLPGDRERCFGGYNQTDNWCIQCPDWVKQQCMRLSPQQQPAQQADGGLNALQQQLQG